VSAITPVPAGGTVLGLDIGGTKVAFALADAEGRIVAHERRPTAASDDAEADLERMAADALRMLERSGHRPQELSVAGVSVPGPIDPARGAVVRPPNLPGWGTVPVRAVLERHLGCPVHVENDANAAALAEWRFGAGRGLRHVVYLTMSTGVGGGLVLGGRIHRGLHAAAGEIGHIPLVWEGEPCACGQRGCLEAYLGGAAWARRLRAVAPADGRVVALAGGRDAVRPEHLLQAARQGDAFARGELERWNRYLAQAIVQLGFLLAPEAVVLGTIAVAAGEALCFEPVRRLVREHSWEAVGRDMQVLPAELGEELPYRAGICAALSGAEAEEEARSRGGPGATGEGAA